MKKKYLKTVEDVLALKDTDTKIYSEIDKLCELKFIDGILCKVDKKTHCVDFNIDIYLDPDNDVFYILEEEPMQKATEADIGKLCWMWDSDCEYRTIEVLKDITQKLSYEGSDGSFWEYCRPLTKEEIKEFMEKAE